MTTEQLHKALRAAPFRPFTLRLADGRGLYVPHPEYVAYSPNGRTAAVVDEDSDFEIIDLLLVVGIDFKPATKGKRR